MYDMLSLIMSFNFVALSLFTFVMWFLVFVFHRLRFRLTLVPLYGLMAALVAYTHTLSSVGVSVVQWDFFFLVSSNAYFTPLLLGILLIYLFDGVEAARKGLEILVIVSILQVVVVFTSAFIDPVHLFIPATLENLRNYFWSVTAMVVDVFSVSVLWEGMSRLKKIPLFVQVPILMFAVLSIDALIFVTGVFIGQPSYFSILKSDIIVRAVLSTVMGIAIAAYLRSSKYSEENRDKPAKLWDILDFRSALVMRVKKLEETLTERQILENKLRTSQAVLKKEGQELLRSKALDEAIISDVAEGLVVVDNSGAFIFFNKQAEGILGSGKKEVKPSDWPQAFGMYYLDKDEIMDFGDFESAKALEGKIVKGEKIRIKGNGVAGFKVIRINASPVKTEKGIIGAVFTFADITKERELEKAKDEFLSMASHQLKTPATGVKAFLSMLLEGDAGTLNPAQRDFAQKSYDANEREIKIVEDLLNVSRIESGRLIIEKKKLDLNNLVEELGNELALILKNQKLGFNVQKYPGPVVIAGDPDKLKMVFGNLLDNARKYTNEGGTVSITVGKEGNRGSVTVQDTGIGIDPKGINKIFMKFQRLDNPKSREVGGTGLGLYIIKKIVELHGGTIKVYSEVGKGSRFVVEFLCI